MLFAQGMDYPSPTDGGFRQTNGLELEVSGTVLFQLVQSQIPSLALQGERAGKQSSAQ